MLDDIFSGWDRGLVVTDAHAAYDRGDYRAAATLYKQAIEKDQTNGALTTRLASALLLSNEYAGAIETGRRAMGLEPAVAAPAVYAAGGALALGDIEQARTLADEALAREPGSVPALLCKADILRTAGDQGGSEAVLREARQLNPGDAMVLIEVARRMNSGDEAARAAQELYEMTEDDSVAVPLRTIGKYTLGALYEKLGVYEDAFRAFDAANRAAPPSFDERAHKLVIDEILSGWTRDRFDRLPTASDGGGLPVFIVGMPRTGSTLVEQILASHPDVHAGGEMPHFGRRAGALLTPPLGPALERLTRTDIDAAAQAHTNELAGLAPGAARVTDKLLSNFMHVGVIRTLFPEAAVIHCTRRPLDTALSCWQHNFRGALGWTNRFESIAAFYAGHDRVIAHWQGVLGIEMLTVPYEELVRAPEAWSRKLVAHVGLDWDDRCLKPHENRRAVLTSSREQVREPVHTRAAGRADRYGALLDPLRGALDQAGVR